MSDPPMQGKTSLTSQIQHLLREKEGPSGSRSTSVSEGFTSPAAASATPSFLLGDSVAGTDPSTVLPAANDNKFLLNKFFNLFSVFSISF